MVNHSPKEIHEQRLLVKYLELKRLKFSSIPNSTWTSSYAEKAKNRAQGLRKGLPDMLVFLPAHKSVFLEAKLIFIEMKRQKGGRVTPEQKEWIECLGQVDNVIACVCKGFQEAKNLIDKYCV
jgi:hypothetical protein